MTRLPRLLFNAVFREVIDSTHAAAPQPFTAIYSIFLYSLGLCVKYFHGCFGHISMPSFKLPSFVLPVTPYVLSSDSVSNNFLWFYLSDAVGTNLYILTLLRLKPIHNCETNNLGLDGRRLDINLTSVLLESYVC